MNKHFQYLSYVVRHKWFVLLAAHDLGITGLGLIHDSSKLLLDEWLPYAEFFYGNHAKPVRDSTGYYKPYNTGDEQFDFAWLLHQKRNKHHWQWWILLLDDGGFKAMPMPDHYRREMLADWIGAGKAQGRPKTWEWYDKNKDNMILHEDTRAWIESRLDGMKFMYEPTIGGHIL